MALRPSYATLRAGGCTWICGEQASSFGERAELDSASLSARRRYACVCKVGRLALSTIGLWSIVEPLEAVEDGGGALQILNLCGETVDTKSATGKLILNIFPGFA